MSPSIELAKSSIGTSRTHLSTTSVSQPTSPSEAEPPLETTPSTSSILQTSSSATTGELNSSIVKKRKRQPQQAPISQPQPQPQPKPQPQPQPYLHLHPLDNKQKSRKLRPASEEMTTIGLQNTNSGHLLEKTDDAILAVNTLKSEWNSKSQFDQEKDKSRFRQYEDACDRVKEFYSEQHEKQTVAYNLQARVNFKTKCRAKMTIWEALERLNTLIDESDPDTELSQIEHALQTAEAIRRDGKPRWMQLTGLIHDLGKLLYFFDAQGQWDVVGDTFPVGCGFDRRIIYPDTFDKNPDSTHPIYSSEFGIYNEGCGLDHVMLSWGHDEYMYHVAKRQSVLPDEAQAMIRYHSFYPWHSEGAYFKLMNKHDEKMLEAVRAFNPYDLYSKSDEVCDVEQLKPYYLELIDEFFPSKVIEF